MFNTYRYKFWKIAVMPAVMHPVATDSRNPNPQDTGPAENLSTRTIFQNADTITDGEIVW